MTSLRSAEPQLQSLPKPGMLGKGKVPIAHTKLTSMSGDTEHVLGKSAGARQLPGEDLGSLMRIHPPFQRVLIRTQPVVGAYKIMARIWLTNPGIFS